MAQFYADFWGPKVELDHPDVVTLAQAEDVVASLGGLGLAAAAGAFPWDLALTAITAWIVAEKTVMQAVDQGRGVWLTLPWPVIWWGQWWLIIPTPR